MKSQISFYVHISYVGRAILFQNMCISVISNCDLCSYLANSLEFSFNKDESTFAVEKQNRLV